MGNKALSVATVIEKNRVGSDVPFLVLIQIEVFNAVTNAFVETIRLANNPEAVTWQGAVYSPWPFSIDLQYEAGGIPDISLSGADYQGVITSKLSEYGGATGSRVTVSIVNGGNLTQPPELQEIFEIISASVSDWSVNLSLGAESTLTRRFPARTQMRDRCAWRYRSPECGYSGALPTCDLSLQGANGCGAHNNTENFGGFPALLSRGARYG